MRPGLLGDAVQLFFERILFWLGVGLIGGGVRILGMWLYSLSPSISKQIFGSNEELSLTIVRVSATSIQHIANFLVAGAFVIIAIRQIRPDYPKFKLSWNAALSLSSLAVAAALYDYALLVGLWGRISVAAYTLVVPLALIATTVPVMIVTPFVVLDGASAGAGVRSSLRLMFPIYWEGFWLLLRTGFVLFLIAVLPVMGISALILNFDSGAKSWLPWFRDGFTDCIWLPCYYLMITLLYLDRTGVKVTTFEKSELPEVESE